MHCVILAYTQDWGKAAVNDIFGAVDEFENRLWIHSSYYCNNQCSIS